MPAYRPLNVVLRPASPALDAYAARADVEAEAIAAGFRPRPDLDLTFRGGRTIADVVFVNRYLGGPGAWAEDDRQRIDDAIEGAMTDRRLQNVIQQYFDEPISARMLPSGVEDGAIGDRCFKDEAEALVARLFRRGVLGDADPASSIICLLLPRGVVLVDGNADGSEQVEADGAEAVLVDDEQADSLHGLGGFHGSVHVGADTAYYAIGVFSDAGNGIDAFDEPWKNVVATFYHELVEAATDPDVGEVIRTGDERLLGWYSKDGGEIGDVPMLLAGPSLGRVMVEVPLVRGGTAPIQLQWSNAAHGPEGPIDAPHAFAGVAG